MTAKEKILLSLQELPDHASIEDVITRLLSVAKIECGLQQADTGQTMTHSAVREKMARWLK